MQKYVHLVDLVKSFPTNIYLQNLALIQKRTSPVKFAHMAEKSGKGSISNLSTKAPLAAGQLSLNTLARSAKSVKPWHLRQNLPSFGGLDLGCIEAT